MDWILYWQSHLEGAIMDYKKLTDEQLDEARTAILAEQGVSGHE